MVLYSKLVSLQTPSNRLESETYEIYDRRKYEINFFNLIHG
jgi:hypothetical protein